MTLSLAFSDAFLVADPSDPETQMAFLRTDEQVGAWSRLVS